MRITQDSDDVSPILLNDVKAIDIQSEDVGILSVAN
jgi:hypothetical protein